MPLPIMTTPKNVKQVTFNDRIAAKSPLQMSPSYSPTSNSTSGSGGGILNASYSPSQIFKSSQQMMAKNVETSTKQNYEFSIRMLGAVVNDGHGRLKISGNTLKQFKEQLSDMVKYHKQHAECVVKLNNNNDVTSRDMNTLTSKVLTCSFDKKRHSEVTATYKTMLQAITTESEKDENEYFATHEQINLLKSKLTELEKEQREQAAFKKAEAERQRKEQEEAKRKLEEEERQRKEAEAEEEARCKAEEEEERKRQEQEEEEERKRQAEEEEERERQAEEESQRKAEEEAEGRKRKHKEVERQRKESERQRKEAERKRKASEEKADRQRKEDERRREAERQRKIKEAAEAELERLKKQKMATAAQNKRERLPIYRSKETHHTPPKHPSPLMDSSAKKKRNSMEDISKTPMKKSNIPKVNEDTGTSSSSKNVATPQVTPAKKVILNTPKSGSYQTPKKTVPQTPKLPAFDKTMDTDNDEEDSFWNDD